MDADYLMVTLECNGRKLLMGVNGHGQKQTWGITSITGLEASDFTIAQDDNALIDGVTVTGKKIAPRPVHIEAQARSDAYIPALRQQVIQFFNPKYTGTMLVEYSGTPRNIEYEIEGWTFTEKSNIHNRLAIDVDLICADPYWKNVDNFGKNMAGYLPMFHFPWQSLPEKVWNTPDPYKGLTLAKHITGYRILTQQAVISNDGDVECGLQIKFVAQRGSLSGPKITKLSTGQFIRIAIPMEQGDVLMVDTDPHHQIIELNGVNSYQYIDRLSDPFTLDVGDNLLEYDADEEYSNLDVYLYYTPLYLGI